MADIDEFIKLQPKCWTAVKQDKFEQRVLLDLLRGFEDKAGRAKHLAGLIGERFGMVWLNQAFPQFPLRLATFKAPKPVPTCTLLKRPDKLSIYRELCELRENYPTDNIGLIFASDGDGLPEMVIHTQTGWRPDSKYWRLILPDVLNDMYMVVDPLDGFIAIFKEYSTWRLTQEVTDQFRETPQ